MITWSYLINALREVLWQWVSKILLKSIIALCETLPLLAQKFWPKSMPFHWVLPSRCHQMSFNLTWWHLMTCHDISWCGQSNSERQHTRTAVNASAPGHCEGDNSEHSGWERNWQKDVRAQSHRELWGLASLEPRTPSKDFLMVFTDLRGHRFWIKIGKNKMFTG